MLSRNYQPVLPTDERQWHDATTFFFEGTNYLPPLCMSQWSKIRFAGLGNNATFLLRNDLLLLDEKQHMNVNDAMGQSQPPDDLGMVYRLIGQKVNCQLNYLASNRCDGALYVAIDANVPIIVAQTKILHIEIGLIFFLSMGDRKSQALRLVWHGCVHMSFTLLQTENLP